jgi:kinesin family protein 5
MGIIPRVMNRLFEMIDQASENIEFSIKVSFLEIYNERIQDLLNPLNSNLKIKESKLTGVFVDDCTEVYVSSAQEMRDSMLLGSQNRTIAATRMNDRSSRSHSIFVMTIAQKDLGSGTTKTSRIYFVDLAGSEKIAKTEVTGKQLEEAKNINKSLTALGIVINTLAEGKKGVHVPYRDSKLTRLLQDSLGGNAMATLLIACSMNSYNDKETLTTLRFGQRAKCIKNKPKENVELSAGELKVLLDAAELKVKNMEALMAIYQSECSKRGITINISEEKIISGLVQENNLNINHGITPIQGTSKDLLSQEVDLLGLIPPDPESTQDWTSSNSSLIHGISLIEANSKSDGQESLKELAELRKKLSKQAQEITDLNEMVEMIQAEMEDLTIENVDLKEKNEKLIKGGIKIISKYHKELGHANMAFEQFAIKVQKKWVQYTQLVSEIEVLRDTLHEISEKIESNPKVSRLGLAPEMLSEVSLKSFKSADQKKEVLLSDFLMTIAQELILPFEKTSLKLNFSEFTFNIDEELMNLNTSINKFKSSVLEESPENHNLELVSKDKQTTAFELDQKNSERNIDFTLVTSLELPAQLKGLLEESQLENDRLRAKLRSLQEAGADIRSKIRADYDVQMIDGIQRHNEELNLKCQEMDELVASYSELQDEMVRLLSQNQDLVSELETLRKSVNHEMMTPRGDRTMGRGVDSGSLVGQLDDQDSNSLIKKVARYRKERDRAEQNARELRARLVISEERMHLESEKNLVLKKTIRELEHELDQLVRSHNLQGKSGENHFSQQVKTLRGGNKQKKDLLPHQINVFTCEDNLSENEEDSDDPYNQMELQESWGALKGTPHK